MTMVNIALEIFGACISVLLMVCCALENDRKDRMTILFLQMLGCNIAVLLCDAMTWILENESKYDNILYFLNFWVYSLGYIITALFTQYMMLCIAQKAKISRKIGRWITGLCAIAVGLVVLSLFNHMYFSFENGVYARGSMY